MLRRMPDLSHFRRLVLRSRRAWLALWLLAGALVLAGVPRWEVHSHALHHHDAAHASDHHHDADTPDPGPGDVVIHSHLAPTLSAALPTSTLAPLLALTPDRWSSAPALPPPRSAALRPPHRPPIG
jgi:hypothetical protein